MFGGARGEPSRREITRLDPAFDALVPMDVKIERGATGFTFTEGPVWRPEGVQWFSDVPGNLIRSVTPAGVVRVLIQNVGGISSAPPGAFIGPNSRSISPIRPTASPRAMTSPLKFNAF